MSNPPVHHRKKASENPGGGGDAGGHRDSQRRHVTEDTPSRRNSTALRPKDTNVPAPQKKQTQKEAAQAQVKVQAATSTHKPAHHHGVVMKARGKHHPLQKKSIAKLLKFEKLRDAALKNFVQNNRHGLLTSFMPGDDNMSPDYMNFLNLSAFGNYERMYTHVAFGESGPIDLLVDTGSNLTWVNKTSYTEALAGNNAQPAEPVEDMRFKLTYGGATGAIEGDIVMDKVTLSDAEPGDASLTFAFGVVDETKCPDAKRWRTEGDDIKGILALGNKEMGRGTVQRKKDDQWKNITLPTIMEKLLERGLIRANIIGIHLQLPDEGKRQADDSSSVSSGSNAGTMDAEFHLGFLKTSICTIATFKWIPATTVGAAARFCGVDLELKYGDRVVMAESPGIIDTGAGMISLPGTVLDDWLAAVNEEQEIVKYDTSKEMYHIKKADFGKLKPIEFKFTRGSNAVFKFEPRQQVYPPTLFRKQVAEDTKGDHFYFVFRRKPDGGSNAPQFNLGQFWAMWYYVVLDPSEPGNKKVGIAEIPNHTDHKWRGL